MSASERGQSASSSDPPTKTTKFKPVPPANVTVRKHGLTPRASFSTPGFGKAKAKPPAALKPAVLDISDDESPSGPSSVPLKRTSSGVSSAGRTRSPSPKRVKTIAGAPGKENIFRSTGKGKGKAAEYNVSVHISPSRAGQSSRRRQDSVDIDDESDEWKHNSLPTSPSPVKACTHVIDRSNADLASKSTKALTQLLLINRQARDKAMDAVMQYHSGEDRSNDIYVLEKFNQILDERIAAIRAELSGRPVAEDVRPDTSVRASSFSTLLSSRGDPLSETSRGALVDVPAPPVETPSDAVTDAWTTSMLDSGNLDGADSDADLWDTQDDIPMDSFDDHPNPLPIAPTSTFVSHTVSTTTTTQIVERPHSVYHPEIMRVLKGVFKLTSFRPNQLEAIEATMDGKDVFVLMPTGGGKSLCFQLPAVCTTGKTRGVTFVVSPLLALMQDQVGSLKSKGADVLMWNSETSQSDVPAILERLEGRGPKPALMYITPEKLKESNRMRGILRNLHRGGQLARFVIDEAHCISMWGQDFREAYQTLGALRNDYPGVPIMALTATANNQVATDIKERLHLSVCAFFRQSFNRTNLNYMVRPKTKKVLEDMAEWIKKEHSGHSGVIYCLSRDNCEDVANNLRKLGLRAKHFHAAMDSRDKNETQKSWQTGQCDIIVATIAFGMGIDKPDVRFVIHHSLPKSLDGYYQETGRAGRDGEPSDCLLYYSFGDRNRLTEMLKKPKQGGQRAPDEVLRAQLQDVERVVSYCDNLIDCRRVQLLAFYDETFDPKECRGLCDNCASSDIRRKVDYTSHAKAAVAMVKALSKPHSRDWTAAHFVNVLEGRNQKAVRDAGHDKHPSFGVCTDMAKGDAGRLFVKLISLDALDNYLVANRMKYNTTYTGLGNKANAVLGGEIKVTLDVLDPSTTKGAKPSRKRSKNDAAIAARDADARGHALPLYDDDERTAPEPYYPDQFFEDDPIVEAASPPPSSPAKSKRGKALAAAMSVVDVDAIEDTVSSSDDGIADVPELDERGKNLWPKLVRLRKKLAKTFDVSPKDVFDDETLGMLSLTCPTDPVICKQAFINLDEDQREHVWEKYGSQILQLCISCALAAEDQCAAKFKPKPANSSFDAGILHQKFSYHDPSASTSTSISVSSGPPKSPKQRTVQPSTASSSISVSSVSSAPKSPKKRSVTQPTASSSASISAQLARSPKKRNFKAKGALV